MQFANYPELTNAMADDLIERLIQRGLRARFGASNQSCSRYVTASVEDEDDEIEEFKIRFSDHADRYGSDLTIRIDSLVETIVDEFGDYEATQIEDWRYMDALAEAELAVLRALTN